MFKKILKTLGYSLLAVIILALMLIGYFNIPVGTQNREPQLGVTFSSRYANDIHIDWKAAYVAMLDDLKIRKVRIPVYWDLVSPQEDQYDFSDLDWQLEEARKREAEIILVVGQKVPRWPECAIPQRLSQDDAKRKEELIKFIKVVINRYKDNHPEIKFWQVENEPFFALWYLP